MYKLISKQEYYWANGAWVAFLPYIFYYSDGSSTVGIAPTPHYTTSITCFPNPSTGIFSIQSDIGIQHIQIRNMAQHIVFETANAHNIDLRHQPKGVYFAQIRTEKGTAVQKLVVE